MKKLCTLAGALIAIFVLSPGCTKGPHDDLNVAGVVPPPPDVGTVTRFKSCSIDLRRTVNESEKCQIEKLSARCLPADDCMVQCLSSPDGVKVGGGCEHVCFSGLHIRPPSPPKWSECFEGYKTSNLRNGGN